MQVFLTATETAKILRTSLRTLERTRLEGTGPRFVKFGRRVLYRPEDVATWAAENVVSSTAQHEGEAESPHQHPQQKRRPEAVGQAKEARE